MSTSRQSQALATRQRLVDVATTLFATHGFASVTTTSLSETAGVTRGALYHHFANMGEVMEAVFERAEGALVDEVDRALGTLTSSRERLLELGPVTLDVLLREPVIQRIVFVEGPAALGWTRWRALDGGRSVRMIEELLADLQRSDELVSGADPRTTAQLILGAINEGGMQAAALPAEQSEKTAGQLRLLCSGLLIRREGLSHDE